MKILVIIIISGAFCACSGPVKSQSNIPTATIKGIVTESESPHHEGLPGCHIDILELDKEIRTDINGNYVIEAVPIGSYTIRFTMTGYQEKVLKNVIVKAKSPTIINVVLDQNLVQMTDTPFIVPDSVGAVLDAESDFRAGRISFVSPYPLTRADSTFADSLGFTWSGGGKHTLAYANGYNIRMNRNINEQTGKNLYIQIREYWRNQGKIIEIIK
jgi:hypothetical protein